MGDQYQGVALGSDQPVQQIQHLLTGRSIKIPGRFIRQYQSRLMNQRPDNGDPLLFATRKSIGITCSPISKPDLFQQLESGVPANRVQHTFQLQG